MTEAKFVWMATADNPGMRDDIDAVFLTRAAAEEFVEKQVEVCWWEIQDKHVDNDYTRWICTEDDVSFELFVSAVPFNNF